MADHDMTDKPDPALIQAPAWVHEDGYDLPVSQEKPAVADELQVVLDAAPLGPNHALVRERTGAYDTHNPIYPNLTSNGTNRSYYGALLMALFNLSPFLNFIEEAANKKAFNDHIFVGLHALAKAFHNQGEDQQEDEENQGGAVWSLTETVWQYLQAEGKSQAGPWKGDTFHPSDFLDHLFSRIDFAELQPGQFGGSDV